MLEFQKSTKPSFVMFQEQECLTDFEYTGRNVAKKIFSATQGLELVFQLSSTK
jgi:hypothetical protein